MKRKQHSELRCNPINIQLSRSTPKTSLFGVQKLQPFFPPIECLFKTESVDKVSEYGIKFPDVTINGETATTPSGEIQLHPKITMLLNPYKWMKGINLELPSSTADANEIRNKLQSPHNAAYVGSLFNAVFSLSKCHHFPRVVGVYSGVSQEFKLNISDDYEELIERPWFSRNVGKTFTLQLESSGEQIQYTRTARLPLDLGDEVELEDIQELVGIASDATVATEFQKVFEEEDVADSDSDSDISTAYIFDIESVSEYSLDEEEEDEEFAWATFNNVPVQLTLMEKLEGTFYDLTTQIPDPSKWYAWLFQITFALAFAQRNFGFTHNDLHGNNVMYVRTNQEYFYYTSAGTSYRVPTHGYLLKLIDFDRGIGYVRLPGMKEPRLFMSDQFDASNEAGGQYNMQPFFKESFPVVKPNPSFDLVRLATSMFWDLYPDGPEGDYQNDRVFKLFMKWMKLEDGTSVLFHEKNPKLDRYYGFSLYKAIARYCKDVIPRKELAEFTEFVGQVPAGELPLILDP